jgi:hypothetical protein
VFHLVINGIGPRTKALPAADPVRTLEANAGIVAAESHAYPVSGDELLAFLSVESPQAEAEVDVEQHAVAILAKARGG